MYTCMRTDGRGDEGRDGWWSEWVTWDSGEVPDWWLRVCVSLLAGCATVWSVTACVRACVVKLVVPLIVGTP